jgi:enterochelin esterase-like enzyme
VCFYTAQARVIKLTNMNYKQYIIIGIALLLGLVSSSYKNVAEGQQTPTAQSSIQNPSTSSLTYRMETYDSQAMGGKRQYGVCLPAGYDQNLQRYPVVFLLHGGDGDATDWFNPKKGSVVNILQQLYAAGKLPPSIIIAPDGNDLRGKNPKFDPQYFDGINGKLSTAIGDELVQVVSNRYRTLPYPNYWAIGGLSSGGWGAVNIGLHHLNHFSILFSHSGYFVDKSGAQNSPIKYIKTLSPQQRQKLQIYLDAGNKDKICHSQTQKFHSLLDRLQVKNVFHSFSGDHSWRYWRQHLADSLTFVGEQFHNSARSS